MHVKCLDGVLAYQHELDMAKVIASGQTFRWNGSDGLFEGRVGYGIGERNLSVRQQGEDITVSVGAEEFQAFWFDYFDLGTDYSALKSFAKSDVFFARCLEFGKGLRVLKQDLWEMVVTFILSQRSNIPRIGSTIAKMVELCGHFPAQEEISNYIEGIGCGYRLPYLKDAAGFDFSCVYDKEYADAKAVLKQIKGIGNKVADCVILFGLHDRRAFPVDVWIERIIERKYSGTLDTSVYGNMAGIVQQYMFYYAINHRKELIFDEREGIIE